MASRPVIVAKLTVPFATLSFVGRDALPAPKVMKVKVPSATVTLHNRSTKVEEIEGPMTCLNFAEKGDGTRGQRIANSDM